MQTKNIFPVIIASLFFAAPGFAQGGSPMPGGDPTLAAPLPGAAIGASDLAPQPVSPSTLMLNSAPAQNAAPVPGKTGRNAYGHLPLTVKDAKNRLVELRNALAVSRPRDLQDPIYQLAEWLNDSADAHNKMANAFAKHDDLKAQYQAEKQIGIKFSQLKREAQLLKADLLIAQKRYPEALGPLVEIVLADPTSATGKTAYQRLKDLGFSHDAESAAAASPGAAPGKPATPGATPTKPAAAGTPTAKPSAVESAAPVTSPASAEAASLTGEQGTTKVTPATKSTTTVVKQASVKSVAKPATKPVVKISAKPISHSISIASKRRVH